MASTTDSMGKLQEMPPASAIALQMEAKHYFDAVRALLDVFAPRKHLHSIYVTATIPSKSIISALEVLDVDLKRTHFVDCVSSMMMGFSEKDEGTVYVESPTMLENILLKVEFLIRKLDGADSVVIIDSINSLAIHNSLKIVSEFLHILINHLRSRNAYTVIFAMEEYTTEEVENILSLVCDETVNFTG
ncbi:MAG: ATPase domain-containing protein [Thermoplasmata archaeon]